MLHLKKRAASFRYAFQGVRALFATQANARLHLVAAAAAVAAGLYFDISRLEWAAIALSISLVWAMEAANTAIEALTDLASPEQHPLAGRAKDLGAAAVLLAAMGALAVGILVLGPKLAAALAP